MTDTPINDQTALVILLSERIRHSGLTFKKLSERTSLAASTISRIAYRETYRPQFRTLLLLLQEFGLTLYVRSQSNVVPIRRSA